MANLLPEDIIMEGRKTGRFNFEAMEQALAREAERVAQTFPSLRDARGISPWNPEALDEWVNGPLASKAAYQSASFLLDYYVTSFLLSSPYNTANFNIFEAMREWSDGDRDAFRNVWRGNYSNVDQYDLATGRLIKGRSQTRKWREQVTDVRDSYREAFKGKQPSE